MLVPHSPAPRAPSARYAHLVVRLMPAVYQRKAIPAGLSGEEILARTQRFATAWDLWVAVVWAPDRVTCVEPDGTRSESSEVPRMRAGFSLELPPLLPTTAAYCGAAGADEAITNSTSLPRVVSNAHTHAVAWGHIAPGGGDDLFVGALIIALLGVTGRRLTSAGK